MLSFGKRAVFCHAPAEVRDGSGRSAANAVTFRDVVRDESAWEIRSRRVYIDVVAQSNPWLGVLNPHAPACRKDRVTGYRKKVTADQGLDRRATSLSTRSENGKNIQ